MIIGPQRMHKIRESQVIFIAHSKQVLAKH